MRILIDECLSPALVTVAYDAGFEAYHVAHRGWAGYTDGQLLREILREEFDANGNVSGYILPEG